MIRAEGRKAGDQRAVGKIAVSLPQAQIIEARRAMAEGRAPSVSAYVSKALSRTSNESSLAALVAELVAEHGSPTPADYAWADEVLGSSR